MFSFFKKQKQDYGVIYITPYLSTTNCEIPVDIRKTVEKISKKLGFYEDIMCKYGHSTSASLMRIQQISANYNTANNKIEVIGIGSKNFHWLGNLEQFLNCDAKLLIEGHVK